MSERRSTERVWTIGVGGAAGDGVREAGVHFGEFAQRIGCHAFLAFYYPSLIRGGHNFARVSFSPEEVHADHAALDILVALNAESVRIRAPEVSSGGIVIVESVYADEARAEFPDLLTLPMQEFVRETGAPRAASSSASIGALAFIAGVPKEEFTTLAESIFSDLVGGRDLNIALAIKGYEYAEREHFPVREEIRALRCVGCVGELLEGNKGVASGFLAAGLECYVGYPMTPSTSILHFLAKESAKGKLKVIHPEDEIAVINMALGAVYAGKRAAVGTANGGFALMQESFSLAGISELPIVVAVSQRQGPATGVATHTGQSDLRFAIHAGHGEFPRLVIAPGTSEECFDAGMTALNLSWKYQIPSIVLLDKQLSESFRTACVDLGESRVEKPVLWDKNTVPDYRRFAFSLNGISPLGFPGTSGAAVKATSYEHDEFGVSVDRSKDVLAMQNKRWKKLEGLRAEFRNAKTIARYGDDTSDTAILCFGSTIGAVREAQKMLATPVRIVQVIWVEPFDVDAVSKALSGATRIIAIEGNHGAQLAGLLREKTGIVATETITKYDSEPFEPASLARELEERLNKHP